MAEARPVHGGASLAAPRFPRGGSDEHLAKCAIDRENRLDQAIRKVLT
jgi:hypothetical protein